MSSLSLLLRSVHSSGDDVATIMSQQCALRTCALSTTELSSMEDTPERYLSETPDLLMYQSNRIASLCCGGATRLVIERTYRGMSTG